MRKNLYHAILLNGQGASETVGYLTYKAEIRKTVRQWHDPKNLRLIVALVDSTTHEFVKEIYRGQALKF